MTASRFARLEEIFLEAIELGEAERGSFLSDACGGDAELEGKVRTMIGAHPTAHEALPTRALGPMDAPEIVIPRGKIVGGCTLERTIGHGGMGVVYEATQHLPRRRVAIKLLPPGLLSSRMLPRFELEVEAMSRLRHPGIAQVFSAGTVDLGFGVQPFFVMEFIDGRSLRATLDDGAMGVSQSRRVLVDLAGAVHHAHQRGVIHRDLKPENILIDADGRPHVVDFGIAKLIGERGEHRTRHMTCTGERLYTIAYAAPEQIAGERGEADVRTDVYALGVIGYEMLAGRRPYDTDGTIEEAVRHITTVRPEPSPLRDAGASRDLATVILKALAKEPDRRYQSVTDLCADLVRTAEGGPIAARRESRWYVFTRTLWRHRIFTGAALLSVLAIAVAALVALMFALSARRSEHDLESVLATERIHHAVALTETDQSREAEAMLWPEFARLAATLSGPLDSLDASHPQEPSHWRHVVSALRGVFKRVPCVRTYPVPKGISMTLAGAVPGSRQISLINNGDGAEWTLDVVTGVWARTPRDAGTRVSAGRLAPGGELMVTGVLDNEDILRVWAPGAMSPSLDLSLGLRAARMQPPFDVRAGKGLAIVGNRTVVVDFDDWTARVLTAPDGTIGAAMIPDSEEVLFADLESIARGTVRSDDELAPYSTGAGYAKQVVIDDATRQVFTGEQYGIGVSNLDAITAEGTPPVQIPLRFGAAYAMALDAGGRHLSVVHLKGNITVLDLDELSRSRILGAGGVGAGQDAIVPAPQWLVSGGRRATSVRVWNLAREPQIDPADGDDLDSMLHASLSRSGRLRATGDNGTVVSEEEGGFRTRAGHLHHASGLVVLGDSNEFVTIGLDGRCLRWGAGQPDTLAELPGRLYDVAASADGLRVAVAGEIRNDIRPGVKHERPLEPGPILELIDLSGREWITPRTTIPQVMGVAFAPDGARIVACGNQSRAIESWTLDGTYDGEPTTLAVLSASGRALAWHPDGTSLAVGADDGRVWILDRDGAHEPRLLGTQASGVHVIAFSPVDPNLLVSGSGHGQVRLWDVQAGIMLGDLLPDAREWRGKITCLEFTRDGAGVLVAGEDQRLGILSLDYFDSYIAGNVNAWLANHPDVDSEGAGRLAEWAKRRLTERPPALWLRE